MHFVALNPSPSVDGASHTVKIQSHHTVIELGQRLMAGREWRHYRFLAAAGCSSSVGRGAGFGLINARN